MRPNSLESKAADDFETNLWQYVSASRLNTWLSCPWKFKLRYVEGLSGPATASLTIGASVHRGLEHYYRTRLGGSILPAAAVLDYLDQQWPELIAEQRVAFDSAADELAALQQARGLVTAYLQAVATEVAIPQSTETVHEADLVDPESGEQLGIRLLGVIDLVLEQPEGAVIVDFKTASRQGSCLDLVHEVQLTSYAYLYRSAHRLPEHHLQIRSLIKTRQPQLVITPLLARTGHHFARYFEIIRAYLDSLDRQAYPARPGLECTRCEFRSRCSSAL